MKRLSPLLVGLLLLTMLGCAPAQEPFRFTYQNIQITPHAEAAPILQALGTPVSYTEEPSCAFDGLDKTYCYGSFYLSTYPHRGKDHIYRVWLTDDSTATEEGLRIGDDAQRVDDLYQVGGSSCTLTKADTTLTILITDGLVSSIQYEALLQ